MRTIAALRALGVPLGLLCAPVVCGAARPIVFWASAPVRPNETVLVTGEDLADVARVAVTRLRDDPALPASGAPRAEPWRTVAPLQVGRQSLKFVLPADLADGVFECRLDNARGERSRFFLLNAPDPWWAQGDAGRAVTPGGTLRVYGKSLGSTRPAPSALLRDAGGKAARLTGSSTDGFEAAFVVPASTRPGRYTLSVHNGHGGSAAWAEAGAIEVQPHADWPGRVIDVMDFYGKEADRESRRTLAKGAPSIDRTAAFEAALAKAQAQGGGVVYLPAGVYTLTRGLHLPPRTVLRGEGAGRVTLWWGKGGMALDGGSDERRLDAADSNVPPVLISGADCAVEDLTLIAPRQYQTGLELGAHCRLRRVRMRVDRYWVRTGQREDGLAVRLADDCQVTDCDILARGVAIAFSSGRGCVVAHNRILAGKSNIALERADGVDVEDNQFVSLDPTAYINLSGEGRCVYYARNRHEALFSQQSDFSWTFDGTGQAYLGKLASASGVDLTLAADPVYPGWAGEAHLLWRRAAVCVLEGRGAGQYRLVTANRGRTWTIDKPFDVAPDATSTVCIIPYRGRVLVIGNRFEDAGWVNMGYGSSFDVVCAGNDLYRAGAMLNLGLRDKEGIHPSWYVQYLDDAVHEGHTLVQTTADQRNPELFAGTVTRAAVHRRLHVHADNSGNVNVGGNASDVIVEDCVLDNPLGRIQADANTTGVLFRRNRFAPGTTNGYEGDGLRRALLLPPPK